MKLIENKNQCKIDFDFREMFYYWTILLMIGYTLRAIIALKNGETIISLL